MLFDLMGCRQTLLVQSLRCVQPSDSFTFLRSAASGLYKFLDKRHRYWCHVSVWCMSEPKLVQLFLAAVYKFRGSS